MWSVQNKPREMQGSSEVWILSASHRQMFWLGFNRHIHYLCSDAGWAGAAQQTCALQCPGTPVWLSLQTSPWPVFLHGLAGAMLCSPTWALKVFLLAHVEWTLSHCSPALDCSSAELGAHPLPSVQFYNLHCHLAPWSAVTDSKARRHLWLFPKSVMMEVGEEVLSDLWQAAPACWDVSQAGKHHTQENLASQGGWWNRWSVWLWDSQFLSGFSYSWVWAAHEVGAGLGCAGVTWSFPKCPSSNAT